VFGFKFWELCLRPTLVLGLLVLSFGKINIERNQNWTHPPNSHGPKPGPKSSNMLLYKTFQFLTLIKILKIWLGLEMFNCETNSGKPFLK